ncbi:MAG: pilus assembly protein PilP [Rhodoferax sp.]|nr:pilus assembly protein PilP [Rhodoferax sp.]
MMTLRSAVLLCVAGALTACGSSSGDELSQWMAAQKAQAQPKIKPIAEPKQFKPESYTVANEADPFSKLKLTQALGKDAIQAASNGALIAPELKRRKEPLEDFPLDSMTLVGSMVQNQKPVGLVKVGPLLYQVRPGDYMGQNYGRVIKIVENEVTLREIVQDAVGEWIERPASLLLQERSK